MTSPCCSSNVGIMWLSETDAGMNYGFHVNSSLHTSLNEMMTDGKRDKNRLYIVSLSEAFKALQT